MMKTVHTSEAKTLKAICDFLDLHNYLYLRINPISPVTPGKWRKPRTSQKGAPDLIFWQNGQTYAIEVKSYNGKQSPDQKHWQERAELNHLKYHIVHNFQEFLQIRENAKIRGGN